MSHNTNKPDTARVIQLAERAREVIEITELEPRPKDGVPVFIGKHINLDGSVTQYPNVTWWRQSVARVPATIPALFAYLREARKRNICLIRGAPANIERQKTRRRHAGIVGKRDRRDHGFLDEPTKLVFLDVDGAEMNWKDDPERAVRALVAQLEEPWRSTSFCWFFSATHGLEMIEVDVGEEEKKKRWSGRIADGKVRVRLVFIAERTLAEREAVALTNIMKAHAPELKLDRSISFTVQPNYITRPHWIEHPDRDVLGEIPTIGWVKGTSDYLAVPDDLTYTARWAKAQGHGGDIADHPDAESAVRGIGSDGHLREHMKAAVEHLLRDNPIPDVVNFDDHSADIADKLRRMIDQHRDHIDNNLSRCNRRRSEVLEYMCGMPDYARWCLDHQAVLRAKTIKLTKEERDEGDDRATRDAIFERVKRAIEQFSNPNYAEIYGDEFIPTVVLLVAPTGSRKSTEMRSAAVRHVETHPDEKVVIMMPRHKLGDEQIKELREQHPAGNYSAAVWRGRHADDPDTPHPQHKDKFRKMCWRSDEAEELELAMLNVEHHLCKQGRGKKVIKCPFYDRCGYQRQKLVEANIWFAAHECMTHEMPKAFGKVGWVIIDESPLDAFMFGVDINDAVELAIDKLRDPAPPTLDKSEAKALKKGRDNLYRRLGKLTVPINRHRGVPVPCRNLDMDGFAGAAGRGASAHRMRVLEWKGKVKPDIRPDMTKREVRGQLAKAADNGVVAARATLWQLVEEALDKHYARASGTVVVWGRVQVHRGDKGRVIRMVGMHPIAKGWDVRTLICDATGDAELLRAIWPQLETDESVRGWEQLPRPKSVRVFQCVDRSISKWAIAIESKNEKELKRKIESARKVYAAVLTKALQYGGGADVGVIIYKSTRLWIEQNCFVPEWLKLFHHGDTTGTNKLKNVRAEFVIGRPLAAAEDITRQGEAMFGEYIAQRDYREVRKGGRIPTVSDANGNNTIRVDTWEHRHAMGERLRRQVTEGAIIQAAGRARAGLRNDNEPLDLHLWTDVAVPELGPIGPVLWEEVAVGLDGVMLATGGVWLESAVHAAEAYPGLFTVDGLRSGRKSSGGVLLIGISYKQNTTTALIRYQRTGERQRPSRAVTLRDLAATRTWLEERLGPLAMFEVEEGDEVATSGGNAAKESVDCSRAARRTTARRRK